MISIQEATDLVLKNRLHLATEKIPLSKALGRVLAEEIRADRDFPPFDRVTMDGIAVDFGEYVFTTNVFPIIGIQAAGMPQKKLEATNTCFEVMTGAILPEGTDTVIRYEDLKIEGNKAAVNSKEKVIIKQNVHHQGSDRAKGDLLVEKNTIINSATIAIAATVGLSKITVKKLPKVVIISSGDELVPVHKKPLTHQIRRSNNYAIQGVLAKWGIKAKFLHINDEEGEVTEVVKKALQDFDALILSGGVSMGKFDLIPKALNDLGVTKLFHKVKQRPGKPFWFGHYQNDTIVFALPGNPVSSFMCANRYVIPWLRASLELPIYEEKYATLSEQFSFKPALQYLLPVKIFCDKKGQQWAIPLKGNGSGDHANLANADAFMELPAERDVFEVGEAFPIFTY